MKDFFSKFGRIMRRNTGRIAMVLCLCGFVSFTVYAEDLQELNKSVSIQKLNIKLNANGRISYDANKDGKPEVYYDYKDYQTLGDSLTTINDNEQTLMTEYTRLYNVAENNRKLIINAWNNFGLSTIDVNTGTYITGSGTASILGAIQAMGTRQSTVATTNEVRNGYSAVLPTSGWVVGTMPEYSFSQIKIGGTYVDDNGDGVFDTDSGGNLIVRGIIEKPGDGYYTGGEVDTSKLMDFIGTVTQTAKEEGKKEGKQILAASIGKIQLWDGVATKNLCEGTWDDGAGVQDDGKSVLLQDSDPKTVMKRCVNYIWWEITASAGNYDQVFSDNSGWTEKKISSEHYVYTKSYTEGDVTYTGYIVIWSNTATDHKLGDAGKFHIGNAYVEITVG